MDFLFKVYEGLDLSAFNLSSRSAAVFAVLLLTFLPFVSYAKGGVAIGATRVIYSASSKQMSLSVSNSDEGVYLIQSWIEDQAGHRSNDFIMTPPLFLIKAKSENTLRLIYTGPPLAKDRETLFWVNVKAIPSKVDNLDKNANVLQLAIVNRIKLFYRPDNLLIDSVDAPGMLQINQVADTLVVKNPSPYFVSLSQLTVGTIEVPNAMIEPRSEQILVIPAGAKGHVSYHAINDYGAMVKIK